MEPHQQKAEVIDNVYCTNTASSSADCTTQAVSSNTAVSKEDDAASIATTITTTTTTPSTTFVMDNQPTFFAGRTILSVGDCNEPIISTVGLLPKPPLILHDHLGNNGLMISDLHHRISGNTSPTSRLHPSSDLPPDEDDDDIVAVETVDDAAAIEDHNLSAISNNIVAMMAASAVVVDGGNGSVDDDQKQQLEEIELVRFSALSELQRCWNSANSAERQQAIRAILRTLQCVEDEPDAVQSVFEIVQQCSLQDQSYDALIRVEILEQLPLLCMHCSQDNLRPYIFTHLFPILVKFLADTNHQVRKTCQAAVCILVEQEILTSEDLENRICPVLLDLADNTSPDEIRIEAISLLCKLMNRERTAKFLLQRYIGFCQDPLFHVRKICAAQLGELSRLLGVECTERVLVPHLIALSQDTVWGVRKACAECFTDLSNNCSMKTRRRNLAPAFLVLLADHSRWVQSAAFQALGPFISTFADSNRTGLKWVDGELIYEEPSSPNEYDSAVSSDDDQQQSLSNHIITTKPTLYNDEDYMEIDSLLESVTFVNSKLSNSSIYSATTSAVKKSLLSTSSAAYSASTSRTSIDSHAINLELDEFNQFLCEETTRSETMNRSSIEAQSARLESDHKDDNNLHAAVNNFKSTDLQISQSNDNFADDSMTQVNSSSEEQVDSYTTFQYWKEILPELPTTSHSSSVSTFAQELSTITLSQKPKIERIGLTDDPQFVAFMDKRFSYLQTVRENSSIAETQNENVHSAMQQRRSTLPESDDDAFISIRSYPAALDLKSLEFDNLCSNNNLKSQSDKSFHKLQSGSDSMLVPSFNGENSFGDDNDKTINENNSSLQSIIPSALLDQYLSMVEPIRAQTIENDISRHCAFNLPAVAFTIGRKNWPCLKQAYVSLANDFQWKVRRTLAFSIHELAAILGPDLTVSDLLPVFTGFLKDVDEVRVGVLKNMYNFVKILEPDQRKSVLHCMADFMSPDNPRNWRFRLLLAEQLVPLCDLYEIEDINEYFTPIALTLATERIADIRKVTFKLLARMMWQFYHVEYLRSNESALTPMTDRFVADVIKAFAKSEQYWRRRQTFVFVCREIIDDWCSNYNKLLSSSNHQEFEDMSTIEFDERKFQNCGLMRSLLMLQDDRVPNVRIAIAELLSSNSSSCFFRKYFCEVEHVLKKLSCDTCRDVKALVQSYFDKNGIYGNS